MAIPLLNDVESFKLFAMVNFLKKGFFLLLIVGAPIHLFPQLSVTGTVTDKASGEPLPGAHVRLSGSDKSAITDQNGAYRLANLNPVLITLEASYVGYKKQAVTIDLTRDEKVDFRLDFEPVFSEEAIVIATRADQRIPATYTTVTAGDIAEQNLGQDLPFLLQFTPSLVTTSDAGAGIGYTGIRIRGTDITRINVTLNGVPVNDPESQAVFFVNLPDLATSLESVQIQRGVGTSANGAPAFGASINMQTSRMRNEPYAEINSAAGSFNTFRNAVTFGSGLIDNKWAFDGRLSSINSDGYIDRGWSKLRSFYLSGGYYGNKSILKAIITTGEEKTYQAWEGTPKDSLKTNRRYNSAGTMFDDEENLTGYYDNQTDNYRQDYYQLHYVRQFSDALNLTSTLFYTRGKGYYESYRNNDRFSRYGLENVVVGDDTIRRSDLIRQKWLDNEFTGLNVALTHSYAGFNTTGGGSLNHYSGDHFGYVVWSEFASNSFVDQKWYDNTGTKKDFNIFAKTTYDLNEHLIPFADLQFRYIEYAIEGTHDDLRVLTQDHYFRFFNPKAGLTWLMNDESRIFGSVAVANREPNRSVYRDADPGQVIMPERLIDYEIGYRRSKASLNLELTGYYMDYKDQLVLTGQINNVGAPIMTNVPESYRLGIEMAAGIRLAERISWQLNATFSRNKIKDFTEHVDNWDYWNDPENEPFQVDRSLGTTDISFSPDIVAASIFELEPFTGFKTALQSKFVGRQYIDNTSAVERSLDPYFINDLRFAYTIKSDLFREIELMLSLYNIFNTRYESNAWVYRYYASGQESEMNGYFPQAEFHFMGGVRLLF